MKGLKSPNVGVWVVIIGFVFVLAVGGIWAFMQSDAWAKITAKSTTPINTNSVTNIAGVTGQSNLGFLDYIFGKVPAFLEAMTIGKYSPVVILLAIWMMLFITFGDILSTFGIFGNKLFAWVTAFLIAVISANLKIAVVTIAFFVGIFSIAGSAALILGLGTAFLAFVVVNWGASSWGPWLMRRRALMAAQTTAVNEESGGLKLAGAIEGLGEAGEALAKLGRKKGAKP